MHVTAQKHGLSYGMYNPSRKTSISSFLLILTALFKSIGFLVQFAAVPLSMENFAWRQANKEDIFNPFSETDNWIYLTLFIHIYDLADSIPKINSFQEPNLVGSGITKAT